MKVLLVEPMGHNGGHSSAHPKYLSRGLVSSGVDVSLVTFDGLMGEPTELDSRVKHISFVAQTGVLGRLVRFLPRLFPSNFLKTRFDAIFSTIATFFLALRLTRKEKYQVVHVIDACIPDYAFSCFAAAATNCNLVFTLFHTSRRLSLENWPARFKDDLLKRQIRIGFQLLISRLLETRPATALRGYLYQKASRKNRLAFTCYSDVLRNSYSGSPFYHRITKIPLGAELPESQPLSKVKAREHLGLPKDKIMLLHFGVNHPLKNFEVIFQALQDLESDYNLVFAGKVNLASKLNIPWKLAQKYGLEQNTIIVDRHLTNEEVRFYFYAADAIILSHRKSFTGDSGVLPSAVYFGVPVIASDVSEVGGIVAKYGLGLVFETENPQSLREAVLRFLSLKDKEKQEMKMNLLHFAKTHPRQEVVRKHIKVYQNLLQNPKVQT